MPPRTYHSSQRCEDRAMTAITANKITQPRSALLLHASVPIIENMVKSIIHLAIHKVNFNDFIMKAKCAKLKGVVATLRQQLTPSFAAYT